MQNLFDVYIVPATVDNPFISAPPNPIYIGLFEKEEAERIVRRHELNNQFAWAVPHNPEDWSIDWLTVVKGWSPLDVVILCILLIAVIIILTL